MNWASIIKKSTFRSFFRGKDADVGSAFTIKNYPQKVDEWIFDDLDIVLEWETEDKGLDSFSHSCTASIEGTLVGFLDESEENIRTEKIEVKMAKTFDMYFDISVKDSAKEQKNRVVIDFVDFSLSNISIDFRDTRKNFTIVGAMEIEFEVGK
tara:strand:+ start:486 stop:944 length:459 start_codon:yes stop_codon:yes gene_type:complete